MSLTSGQISPITQLSLLASGLGSLLDNAFWAATSKGRLSSSTATADFIPVMCPSELLLHNGGGGWGAGGGRPAAAAGPPPPPPRRDGGGREAPPVRRMPIRRPRWRGAKRPRHR